MHETVSSQDYIESSLQTLAGRGAVVPVVFDAEEGLRGARDTPLAQPAAVEAPSRGLPPTQTFQTRTSRGGAAPCRRHLCALSKPAQSSCRAGRRGRGWSSGDVQAGAREGTPVHTVGLFTQDTCMVLLEGGEEVSQGPHQPPSGCSSGTLCHQPWSCTKS